MNSVNPGVIDTDFFVNSGLSEKASDNFVKEKSKKIHALGMYIFYFHTPLFLQLLGC